VVVLGIDPGTAITGYGVVGQDAAGEPQLLRYGVFQTKADTPMPERLCAIHRSVAALIRDTAPDAVAVEELFFKRNITTALTVGQARGVVLLAAAQAGVRVYEYKPAEVKNALVGYGKADKQQVQAMLRIMLELPEVPRPDDAADAIAVAICHLRSSRLQQLIEDDPSVGRPR
jgi:crossover junction endodeoxyribonuclease RuvC